MHGANSSNNAALPTNLQGTGTQRGNTSSPAQLNHTGSALAAHVHQITLDDAEAAEAFLKGLHRGDAGLPDDAQAVFNDLIAHEAYELFVQAFTDYNSILRKQARELGKPFTSTLTLQLPAGWKPRAPALMKDAFSNIQVQRLVSLHAQTTEGQEERRMISRAASEVAAILVSTAGVTQLAVCGELIDPFTLRDAMEANGHIESLELGEPVEERELAEETLSVMERETYDVLLSGPKTCASLKRLTIHDAAFIEHRSESLCAEMRWPALTSLTVKGASNKTDRILSIVRAAVHSQQLTHVTLDLGKAAVLYEVREVFNALQGHKFLTLLEVTGAADSDTRDDTLSCFPMAMLCALSCPACMHFKWDSGLFLSLTWLEVTRLQRQRRTGGLAGFVRQMTDELKQPQCKLQNFSMSGFALDRVVLEGLAEGLRTNTSIETLHLARNYTDLDGMEPLMHALDINQTLTDVVLPETFCYYWMPDAPQGDVFGFSRGLLGTEQRGEGVKDDLRLEGKNAPSAEVVEKFVEGGVKAFADTLQSRLYQRLRKLQDALAIPALVNQMAQFLAAPTTIDPVDFGDVAKVLVKNLEDEGSLRGVVRLRETHKYGDTQGVPQKVLRNVKALVKANNQLAASLNMPAAPKLFNRVYANANAALMQAVENGDVKKVIRLLKNGAIDFGGHAQKAAKTQSAAMRAAFENRREPVEDTATSTTTTSTVATTTTTTTTTTTAATTTTATAARRGRKPLQKTQTQHHIAKPNPKS